jgi:predicted patatin/cPLA2 family phospholipase
MFSPGPGRQDKMDVVDSKHSDEALQGDLDPVVARLIKKQELLRRGDPAHSEIKTALFLDGGGMRGVYGAGVVIALEKLGMTEAFDYVIGVSAGAADGAYFLSKQAELGTTIYYQEFASKKFINPWRIRKILNIDYVEPTFRYTKPLDYQQIYRSRSKFFAGVTNADTGCCEFLDLKDPSIDIITAIRASTALPIVYNKNIIINGTPYSDGTTGCGIPVEFIINRLGCNTALFVLNRLPIDKPEKVSWQERLLTKIFSGNYSPTFRRAYLDRRIAYNQSLAVVRGDVPANPGVKISLLYPEEMPISNFSINSEKLKSVADNATLQTLKLFSRPEQRTSSTGDSMTNTG